MIFEYDITTLGLLSTWRMGRESVARSGDLEYPENVSTNPRYCEGPFIFKDPPAKYKAKKGRKTTGARARWTQYCLRTTLEMLEMNQLHKAAAGKLEAEREEAMEAARRSLKRKSDAFMPEHRD